jgi:hypothetical protein
LAKGKEIMSKWILAILMLALAGCSSPAPTILSTPTGIAPTLAPPSAARQPSPSPTATTPTSAAPTSTPRKLDEGSNLPTPTSSSGIKTYDNADWHVAVDYPADWSVRDDSGVVTFLSPSGAVVRLGSVTTGGLTPEDFLNNADLPNTRCTSQANTHGITARVCFDSISFSTGAEFIVKSPIDPELLLELSTNRRTGDLQVMQEMLASVRSTG